MEEDNIMVCWKEIVIFVGAHMIEFAWDISLEKKIQTILEAMEIFGSRMRSQERAIVAMKQGVQLEED